MAGPNSIERDLLVRHQVGLCPEALTPAKRRHPLRFEAVWSRSEPQPASRKVSGLAVLATWRPRSSKVKAHASKLRVRNMGSVCLLPQSQALRARNRRLRPKETSISVAQRRVSRPRRPPTALFGTKSPRSASMRFKSISARSSQVLPGTSRLEARPNSTQPRGGAVPPVDFFTFMPLASLFLGQIEAFFI